MKTADNIVLVCPLDWGIGHATRCVPVIKALQDQGFRVIVAADGRPYEFYRNEYPEVELIRFPGTPIRYSVFKKHDSSEELRMTNDELRIHLRRPFGEAEMSTIKINNIANNPDLQFTKHQSPITNHQSLITNPQPLIPNPGMTLTMLATLPRLFHGFRTEHKYLAKLVEETGANLVISDNRYGCWHPKVTSVFITHQLNIQVPGWMRWVRPILKKFIRKSVLRFSECWIPDLEDEGGLSGRLSHCSGLPPNCQFIGPLTRFTDLQAETPSLPCPAAEIFVMLSGPEPQRTILEELIIGQLRATTYGAIIAGGRTESQLAEVIDGRIHVFPHLPSVLMKHYIIQANYVICRSGYSTLMDLAALGKSAILIPTPGQTEQEYLANRLDKMNIHHAVAQKDFRLDEAIRNFRGCKAIMLQNDQVILKQRIKRLSAQELNLRERRKR